MARKPNPIIEYFDGVSYKKLNPIYQNVRFEVVLNAVGRFSFEYPLADPLSDLLNDRVLVQIRDIETDRFYSGRIIEVNILPGDNPRKQVSGVGLMHEFADMTTVPNYVFINEQYSDLLDPTYVKTLIRPNTWQTTVEPTVEDLTYLSSLQSTLKTFEIVRSRIGYNYRYIGTETIPRHIEFGIFGNDSGVKINRSPKSRESFQNNELVVEENGLVLVESCTDIVNYVYPLGGGGDNGINQLTLRDVDPAIVDPAYPIQIDPEIPNDDTIYGATIYANSKTGPNTSTAYYLNDPVSIARYGEIRKPIVFSDVSPLSSGGTVFTDADRQTSANELYRACVQYLKDNKDKKTTYKITCYGKAGSLNVGDTIHLKYKGNIQKTDINSYGGSAKRVYVDIDTDLYVLKLSVQYLESGIRRYDLQVSNTPKPIEDDISLIGNAIDTINDYSRQRKGSVTTYPVHFVDSLDSAHPAEFLYWIPNQSIFVDYINIKIRVRRFRAYSQATLGGGAAVISSASGGGAIVSSAGGGSHSHTVAGQTALSSGSHYHGVNNVQMAAALQVSCNDIAGCLPGNYVNVLSKLFVTILSDSRGLHSHPVSGTTSTAVANHTHIVTLPNHTHAIQFGIYEDPVAPTRVRIIIDGVDYSAQLGGPYNAFGDFPAGIDSTHDLLLPSQNLGQLDNLLTPGVHTIQVSCDIGRALVELFIYNQFYLSSR